jgi:ABC-type dipeptide/oligopeptide/nickel transport system permease component
MLRFIVHRLLATIPVVGVVALFVFLLLHLSPTGASVEHTGS